MDKNFLRKKNLNLRKTFNQIKVSEIIVSKILEYKPFLDSKNVLIYYPLKYEINLLKLISSPLSKNKNFYLPKICGDNILICPFTAELEKCAFGVMEPLSTPILDISIIDIAFIPCLAIDKNLNRIGYGKGFYDRLFSDNNFKSKKIAVLNKELIVDKITTDIFDKKVDFLITD